MHAFIIIICKYVCIHTFNYSNRKLAVNNVMLIRSSIVNGQTTIYTYMYAYLVCLRKIEAAAGNSTVHFQDKNDVCMDKLHLYRMKL